jgi:hypothetical protein
VLAFAAPAANLSVLALAMFAQSIARASTRRDLDELLKPADVKA